MICQCSQRFQQIQVESEFAGICCPGERENKKQRTVEARYIIESAFGKRQDKFQGITVQCLNRQVIRKIMRSFRLPEVSALNSILYDPGTLLYYFQIGGK